MGGSLAASGMNKCDGTDVLKELNDAFGDPNSDRYKYAQDNNNFGDDYVQNVAGNYKALTFAYLTAGVDVCARWAAYLRQLGTSPQGGPQSIYDIAQTRDYALKHDIAIQTLPPHGGSHVHSHRGSGATPSTIDAPFPLE
jgi:hypothetical protein